METSGDRRIRASCAGCGRFLTFPPSVPPYTTQANAAASPPRLVLLGGGRFSGREAPVGAPAHDRRGPWGRKAT
jgi:hypothetical protein